MCPGVWPEGWLRLFAHPLGGVECRGHTQYPALAPNPLLLFLALQKQQLVFLAFLYLVVHNLLQLRMHAVMFSPL